MDRLKSHTKAVEQSLLEKPGQAADIAGYLGSKLEAWKFSRLLEEVYRGEEPLGQRLTRKLTEYGPDGGREKTARKVRNWLRDRNLPENREELFKICFALGLDEGGAEFVLGATADNGVHFRNPRELVYAFCLREGLDYPEAIALLKRLWGESLPASTQACRRLVKETCDTESPDKMTAVLRNTFKRVRTEEELGAFLLNYQGCFGFHHNTAYRKFVKMLDRLLFPDDPYTGMPEDRAYSIEKAVDEYLRLGMPYSRRLSGRNALQKFLKKRWPTPKSVQDMYGRKLDVDRKTLLLLYVATEGMDLPTHWHGEVRLREHCERLNLMLLECGMAMLNPHSPFDCLILLAIGREDDDFMSCRLERLVRKLFPEDGAPAFIAAKK